MADKKAFALRISPEMLRDIEAWAQEDFRSVNSQIEFLLSEALKRRKKGGRNLENPLAAKD